VGVSKRLVSTRFASQGRMELSQERMELIQAVRKQDVEKVKVRRLLEAVSSTESGPAKRLSGSRSVDPRCRRRTPDSALLCRIQRLRQAPVRRL
jgi:hypothetical protein